MSLILTIIVILIVLGLALYAESLLPIDARIVQLIQVLTIIAAAVAIAQRAGLL